jgi:hypothetical protein
MYFEARQHKKLSVADAIQAATLIHEGKAASYEVLCWTAPDGRELAAVSDDSPHSIQSFREVAVLDMTHHQQIESITFAWIDSLQEKIKEFVACETTDFRMSNNKHVPLDGENEDRLAWFYCGCCGTDFQSTIKKQAHYD